MTDTQPLLFGSSDQDEDEDCIMGAATRPETEALSAQIPSINPTSHDADHRREPLPKKLKLLTAAAIFVGNVTFGTALNTYGPVLTSMQHKYGTDDATISKVFSIMTGAYMVGALCDSFIFKFINRQLVVIFLLATMATVMFITPHCPTLTVFFISAAVLGLCSGSYDVAQFVWMMEMMQKDCPPFVQSQHFFYAVGTVLPSLIIGPFLDETGGNGTVPVISTTPFVYEPNFNEEVADLVLNAVGENKRDKLFVPFTIIGCFLVVSMCLQMFLFTFLRYREPPPEVASEENEDLSPDLHKKLKSGESSSSGHSENISRTTQLTIGSWPVKKLLLVILACSVYGAYQGMEMSTFQFFPKFGQNSNLHLSEAESTYVLLGMNIAFAVGRGLAIIAVFKINCQLILVFNLSVTLLANTLLLSWANDSLSGLWVSSVVFGLGFSSTYASFSAYIERHLKFTNGLGSAMLVCGSSVAAIYPLVIGGSIEKNPLVLSYVAYFSIAVLTFSISALSYLTYKNKIRY